jgi:hypothetical protein
MKMSLKSFLVSDSAVSESIGYILILGIMVFSIGIIYVIGYPALQNSIDNAHLQNMERGFIILGNNIDHVVSQEAPKQNVELNLKGGTLKAKSTSIVYIWYTDTNGIVPGWNYDYIQNAENVPPITTIEYVYHGDKQIGYEFGGVWENIGSNGYVLKSPNIVVGDPFIIPIVDAGISGGSSIGGDGVAKVIIDQRATTVTRKDNINSINIYIESDYYQAWASYFKSINMNPIVDVNSKTVTVTYTPSNPITVMEVKRPLYIDIKA